MRTLHLKLQNAYHEYHEYQDLRSKTPQLGGYRRVHQHLISSNLPRALSSCIRPLNKALTCTYRQRAALSQVSYQWRLSEWYKSWRFTLFVPPRHRHRHRHRHTKTWSFRSENRCILHFASLYPYRLRVSSI